MNYCEEEDTFICSDARLINIAKEEKMKVLVF